MAALVELLGESLLGTGGEASETASILAGKEAVALYFSAHWCPPCRGFTPKFAEWYKKDLKAKGLEVIFVSSDRDEGSFKEYFAEQPWLALPFADRARKDKLSKKFKVQGIPTLVIVDSSGKVITKEGVSAVSEDPTGEEFPWRVKSPKELLAGAKLVGPSGELSIQEAMEGKSALALYFSAHWCPPCRGFTPKLAEWYKKDLKAKGLEVVFVSSDRDEASFKEYFAEQPWLALDFADRKLAKALSSAMKVRGIPSLAVLDKELNVVTTDGRAAVSGDPAGARMPWFPKPVQDLAEGPGSLQQAPTLLVLCESAGPEEAKALEEALEPLAAEYVARAKAAGEEDAEVAFMLAGSGAELAPKIRAMVGLPAVGGRGLFGRCCRRPAAPSAPRLVLLDIPDEGGYYVAAEDTEVTAASVEEFLAGYQAGKLERKQLS